MNPWELARYLIDAKKDVDSMIYLEANLCKVPPAIRKEYCDRIRDHFYINCCVVLDYYLNVNGIKGKKKTDWKKSDIVVESIYYERDKNSAHIDDDYRIKQYKNFAELKNEMLKQIKTVFKISKGIMPKSVDLKFVPHDKVLFRLINGINAQKEKEIRESVYSDKNSIYSKSPYEKTLKAIYDIKEVRGLSEEEKYEIGVVVEVGLNYFETIQNLQDFFVKINSIFGLNYWTSFFEEQYPKYLELKNSGVIDIYDRPKRLNCYREDFINRVYNLAIGIYGKNIFDEKNN